VAAQTGVAKHSGRHLYVVVVVRDGKGYDFLDTYGASEFVLDGVSAHFVEVDVAVILNGVRVLVLTQLVENDSSHSPMLRSCSNFRYGRPLI
jgi:hypothetical protein